ncbi:MAG TPA: bifunctional ADP-dependent NAD(P)H-hydrate dehydratase/NAD(P)H-hydrate epimerase [Porphyromonadaceae bacterium]|nr:bifunctional ADP-dependent NAD(P)H-hydrate dehydratase/NAD(P)H-hydrate epimerase [Porphyromonadaceae bacterium]
MKIFNSEKLREIDKATCEAQQIDSVELMERAASAVSYEIISRFLPGQRIVVVAGPGNNGGDALAVARMLIEQGYRKVEVFLFNVTGRLSHDCEVERKRLIAIDAVDFTEIEREFNPPYLSEDDVVIDGLFGSGLNKPLQGGFRAVARLINESGAYVVSIDVPSGLFGEWNDHVVLRDVVHADLTLTFQTPRLSFFFEENEQCVGEWKILDIDLDENTIRKTQADFTLVESRNVRPLLRPRRNFTGKRDYGSALIMAGSLGMMGAAVMCARATLRCGAGLATVHSARCGMPVLQTAVPEAMFEPDSNESFIADMSVHHNHQVVMAGPGIGTREKTATALADLLKKVKSPLVLDADALNCIAQHPELLQLLPPQTVITPHQGEFDRLFGEQQTAEQRLKKAIEMAQYYNIIIVLKSHHTAIVRPTGRVYFNSSGNPGMATAGAGDVLTGVIGAFIAQGYRPDLAATIGVYIHGLAGDLAASEIGQFGVIASDISDRLGRAINKVINSK